MTFTETLETALAGYGDGPCLQFEGHWFTGADVTGWIDAISARLHEAGVDEHAQVGVVVRNRAWHAAAVVGLLAAGRWVSMIYSFQSPEAIARDIESLGLAAVVADVQDWTDPVLAAAARSGTAGVAISAQPPVVRLVDGLDRSVGAHAVSDGSMGLHVLTSGTTGPPKRQRIPAPVLERTVFSVTGGQASRHDPPELMYWPMGGIGGVCQLVAGIYVGKRIVLLEKFSVAEWVRVVKDYGIQRCGVQPAVVRMLLDADLAAEDIASLEFIISASGPLDPEVRDAFEQRYRIPVLLAYGATEFAGSVCTWTPELYREFGATKRTSSGRVLPDTQVRIIDPDTGAEVPTGQQGILEARIELIGPDWIRTTDLASIDADGFISLHGRADGAINRGGFKVQPESVRRVLVSHPAVRDACVVGVPDDRLGEVPFAVVEPVGAMAVPTESELLDLVRSELPKHCVPVAIAVVDDLPRNPALKVSLRDVKALYNSPRSAEIQR
jgi:acyl-CoA synthetase (AMP-forming)/AMP-acid ligase II